MKCTHDLDQLILLQAGELNRDDEEALRMQIASCEACLDEMNRLAYVAGAPAIPDWDPQEVERARALAYARIGSSWRHQSRRLFGGVSAWANRFRPLPEFALAALLLAVGYTLGARSGQDSVPGTTMAEVHDIELDEEESRAIVHYGRASAGALIGTLEDEPVAQVLEAALSGGNDNGIRLHALKTVRALAQSGRPESELSRAVVDLVRNEELEGLRLRGIWALDALYQHSELPEEARSALLDVLMSQAGDGLRIAALNTLMAHEPSVADVSALQQVSASDPNPYVRSGAARTLERLEGVPLEKID